MNRAKGLFSALTIMFVAALALTLSGCKDDKEVAQQPPQPPAQQYVIKTFPKPDTSDEFQQIHTMLPNGTLVKVEIQYRDGRTVTQLYRPDQTVSEVQETHPHTDRTKSVTHYGTDGQTVIDKSTYRLNGNLDAKTTYNADGSSATTRYRMDGKRLYSESTKAVDGTENHTFYQQDGKTLWAKGVKKPNDDVRVEVYDDTGTSITQVREVFYSKMEITVYAGGKPQYKQTFDGYRSYYYRYYTLLSLDEYESDGTTVKRHLDFERYSYGTAGVKTATDYANGVKSEVRTYRYDGTLETRETFTAGNTTPTVTKHTSSEQLREPLDLQWKKEPVYNDPFSENAANFM